MSQFPITVHDDDTDDYGLAVVEPTTAVGHPQRPMPVPYDRPPARPDPSLPADLQRVPRELVARFDLPGERQVLALVVDRLGADFPTHYLNRAIEEVAELNDDLLDLMAERDAVDRAQGLEQLRRSHPATYRTIVNDAARALDTMLPQRLKFLIEERRDATGSLPLNDPTVLLWLSQLANSQSGRGRSAPSDTAEIAEIERVMRFDRRRYTRDEDMQRRYRELIARRDGLDHQEY